MFRTAEDRFLASLSAPLGALFAFEAEFWAVIIAVRNVREMAVTHAWLESDSSLVVELLHDIALSVPWSLQAAWADYLLCLSSLHLRFAHNYCERNIVADMLASLGYGLRDCLGGCGLRVAGWTFWFMM